MSPERATQPAVAESPDVQAQQYQLGNYTLDAVDQLTGMTADEIEIVANRLAEAARETEDVLRELAHRVREYGVIANERLANFVKTASECADVARTMQASLDQGDRQPAANRSPRRTRERLAGNREDGSIEAIAHGRAPPTKPGD